MKKVCPFPIETPLPRNERARNTDRQVIESYWNGKASAEELYETSKTVRKQRWDAMKNAGVDVIPSYVPDQTTL